MSFALYGAGLLDTPLTSGALESYGEPGPGRWITIYANATHTYMVIAGLRWDTVGDEKAPARAGMRSRRIRKASSCVTPPATSLRSATGTGNSRTPRLAGFLGEGPRTLGG